jgi:hypothetical protein
MHVDPPIKTSASSSSTMLSPPGSTITSPLHPVLQSRHGMAAVPGQVPDPASQTLAVSRNCPPTLYRESWCVAGTLSRRRPPMKQS